MFSRKKIVVTHNGRFHPDDVFAVATLSILHKKNLKIVRSRNVKDFTRADFVVDVGGEYDASRGRFDHHQVGGAGARNNLAPYASFGLIWKEYGNKVAGNETIASLVDKNLVQGIDLIDNGVGEPKPLFLDVFYYDVGSVISSMNSTWKETNQDKRFFDAVLIAEQVVTRLISVYKDEKEGKEIVAKKYEEMVDKRIVILDKPSLSWEAVLGGKPEPVFVVEPGFDGIWKSKAVRDDPHSFNNRKSFPITWAGKTGDELAKISGVKDALFCHTGRFIVAAKSKEGAIELAKKALEN